MRAWKSLILAAVLSLGVRSFAAPATSAPETGDPLAAEVERWASFLKSTTSTDEMWTQIKQGSGSVDAAGNLALNQSGTLTLKNQLLTVKGTFQQAMAGSRDGG